jgi:hypothetical protein
MSSTLTLLEDMRDAPLTFPTPNGGCHPLWILDEPNPLASWESMFCRGTEPVADASAYPPLLMANHWLAHRGQVADARRAAGRERIGM